MTRAEAQSVEAQLGRSGQPGQPGQRDEARTGGAQSVEAQRGERERQVLDRIDRARRRRPRVREERITMAHGAGGKASRTLVEAVFLDAFRNPLLSPLEDAASLTIPLASPSAAQAGGSPAGGSAGSPASAASAAVPAGGGARLALTTDSYVVSPLFFPGGSIGELAVNGTVNDLAVSGATPLYLTAGFILEEGFAVADLNRVVSAMRDAALAAGVSVVTGDTKVVQRGKADGCYINTAGVGLLSRDAALGVARARPGDAIIVSGPIGDHGITIMLARGELDIESDVVSDTAPLNGLAATLLDAVPDTRAMRDATRGGVATILNEIATDSSTGVTVSEDSIPVRDSVRGACELLGIDPMYVACEGRLVAVIPGDQAERAVAALRSDRLGADAAIIGHVTSEDPGLVRLKTTFGGTRIVDLLVGDPLPRIC